MPYLNLATFTARTTMPTEQVNRVEAKRQGYVEARLAYHKSRIDGRLSKRYAVPFQEPVPEIVLGWQCDLTTVDCYNFLGRAPANEADMSPDELAKRVDAEILEAANAESGLFDLPLRADLPSTSGISRGGPLGYSEASPYTAKRRQRERLERRGG